MKIKEAERTARVKCIVDNHNTLSNREDWPTLTKGQKLAMLELECGMSRPVIQAVLKEQGLEL